jgi:hypothetical protein
MGEHAGEAPPQRRGDLGQGAVVGPEAAPPLAHIHLDQRRDRAGMRGDRAGGLRVVGDHLHLGAGRVQLRHRVELLGRDADGVDLVGPPALGEEPGLGQGADGDGAVVGRGQAGHVAALRGLEVRAERHAGVARQRRGHGGEVPPQNADVEHQAGRGEVVERHPGDVTSPVRAAPNSASREGGEAGPRRSRLTMRCLHRSLMDS